VSYFFYYYIIIFYFCSNRGLHNPSYYGLRTPCVADMSCQFNISIFSFQAPFGVFMSAFTIVSTNVSTQKSRKGGFYVNISFTYTKADGEEVSVLLPGIAIRKDTKVKAVNGSGKDITINGKNWTEILFDAIGTEAFKSLFLNGKFSVSSVKIIEEESKESDISSFI
jgi:hypothetical protein